MPDFIGGKGMSNDAPYVPVVLSEIPAIHSTVFVLERRNSGTWRHRAGTVTDVNAQVKAVKVRYAAGPKTIKYKWFSIRELTATAPVNE
jgi:hypothetical protein